MKSSAGFGLVEILLAASISTVGLLGFSVVFQRYQEAHKKVAAVLLASGAELDLVLQIENPLTPAYQEAAIKTALANHTSISGIVFKMHLPPPGGDIDVRADGTTVFINSKGLPCPGNFTNDPSCSFSVQLQEILEGTGTQARSSFSYQIQINPSLYTGGPLGNLATYSIYAPSELYENLQIQKCDTGATPINGIGDIAVRGINRSTGKVLCISKPTPCPAGQFSTGTIFVDDFATDPNSGGHLEVQCQQPSKSSVSCSGADFVLQTFNASAGTTPGDGVTSGSCVFRTMSPQAWTTTYKASKKVKVGRACPVNYKLEQPPSCILTRVAAPPPASTSCGPYTTSWTESCERVSHHDCVSGHVVPGTPATPCSGTPCTGGSPGTPDVYVCDTYNDWHEYIHHTTPSNGGGPETFPATPLVPYILPVQYFGDNSFECEIKYPDLPYWYDTYQDGVDCRGSCSTTRRACTVQPQWEAAEMSVNFSCVLKPPNDSFPPAL